MNELKGVRQPPKKPIRRSGNAKPRLKKFGPKRPRPKKFGPKRPRIRLAGPKRPRIRKIGPRPPKSSRPNRNFDHTRTRLGFGIKRSGLLLMLIRAIKKASKSKNKDFRNHGAKGLSKKKGPFGFR